MIIQRIFIHSG